MASLKELLAAHPPERITVIRTDRVGDLVLSTPFLRTLREGFPRAVITAIVDPYCVEVLERAGLVDEIRTELEPGPSCHLAVALAPRSGSLRKAYDTHAPLRLGYVYAGRPLVRLMARFLLTHCETVTIAPPANVPHEVAQLDLLARRLGLPSSLEYPLTVGPLVPKAEGRLVFHLGDRWLVNGWTFADLSSLLRGLRGLGQVEVTAGPREAALVAQHGLSLEGVRIRSGLSFAEWADLIGSAEVLITPDTGAVHIAAAMNTPVVVAYEAATFDHCSRQWAPWKVSHRSLVKGDPASTIPKLLAAVEELVSNSRKWRPGERSPEKS